MKNPKALIIAVAILVAGVGLMGLSIDAGRMKSIGGGLFLIGCALTSIFVYHELKK